MTCPMGLDFHLNSHVSRFENDDQQSHEADRVHLEPTLTLPYATPWWSVTSEAKLMYTYYNQDFDPTPRKNPRAVRNRFSHRTEYPDPLWAYTSSAIP